jgi:Cu-Zn family superoxide dismutase
MGDRLVGHYEALLESMSLGSGQTSIFDSDGSAIVIHSTADDNMTDFAGNSGDRIACGVITKATAKKP